MRSNNEDKHKLQDKIIGYIGLLVSDKMANKNFLLSCILVCITRSDASSYPSRPNIILFLADDMGYGDIASYGHPTQERTFMDWMADNGLKFTNFYSAGVLCTPSRAALLTGRQPVRSGTAGPSATFIPCLSTGLPRSENTLAEVLKNAGYSTGMVGKWHLGINKDTMTDGYHLPKHHGFDFVGTTLPFTLEDVCGTDKTRRRQPKTERCFLYYGDTLIEQPINLDKLTGRLVQDAKAFLHNQTDGTPFFFYLPFPQVHTPMFNMPQFKNVSMRGAYGDQLLEISWAMEEIYSTLQNLGLNDNTLIVFMSDHGPQLESCNVGGISGHLRAGKGTYREGGLRVPAIFHWPEVISRPRVSDAVVSAMDILPTFAELSGANLPNDRILDGLSFTDVLFEKNSSPFSERNLVYFMCQKMLMAVRYKDYKVYYRTLPELSREEMADLCKDGVGINHLVAGSDCRKNKLLENPEVFDLKNDPGETTPLPQEKANSIVQEIATDVLQYLQTFEEPIELLSHQFCSSSLVPCCNPPYCVCKDAKMPMCAK